MAMWTPSDAHSAAVENQAVAEVIGLEGREGDTELGFDFSGVFGAVGEAE